MRLTESDSDGNEKTLKRAPSAADIAGLGEPHHLNLPGSPLGDTCDYARDFATVIVAVRQIAETGEASFTGAFRGMWQRFRRVVGAQLLATVGVIAMALTVIGIPFAAWKYIGWMLIQQQILFEDKPLRGAFRGSSELARGRWWYALRVAAVFWLIGVVTGPTLGFALIFADISLILINAIGALVFALLVPYIAIGRTLLYFDLQAEAEEEPAKRWRERLPWRATPARGAGAGAVGFGCEAARLQRPAPGPRPGGRAGPDVG